MASNVFPPDGHVGIGTSNPKVTLDLHGHLNLADPNGAGVLYFPQSGTYPNLYIRSSDNPPHEYQDRVFIGSSGRVGIGTINPAHQLEVIGPKGLYIRDGANGGGLLLRSDGTGQTRVIWGGSGYVSGAGMAFNVVSTSNSLKLQSKEGRPVIFQQGTQEVGRFSGTGKLGIGYTAPAQALSVKGSAYVSESASIGHTDPAGWKLRIEGSALSSAGLYVKGRSNFNGKLAIGTTNVPVGQAEIWQSNSHVAGSGPYTGRGNLMLFNPTANTADTGAVLTFGSNFAGSTGVNHPTTRAAIKGGTSLAGNTGAGFLSFYTVAPGWGNKNIERMRIDHFGNVGIGVLKPEAMLDVSGAIKARGAMEVKGELRAQAGISTEFQMHITEGNTQNGTYIQPAKIILAKEQSSGRKYHLIGSDDSTNTLFFLSDDDNRNEAPLMALQPAMQYLPGNVGIGTETPQEMLEVMGTVQTTGSTAVYKSGMDSQSPTRQFDLIGTHADWSTEDIYIAGNNFYQPEDGDTSKSHAKKVFFGKQKTMTVDLAGNVGIGTDSPKERLDVRGALKVTGDLKLEGKLKIHDWEIGIPDYVFEPDYALEPLSEIESYVKANKHLPEIPSEKEFEEQGIDLTELSLKLLKKVEELTLHAIDQDKRIKTLLNPNAQ